MPIDPRLLEMVVCPACRVDVRLVEQGDGLECQSCGRVYPIRDGIPVMMVEEASAPKDRPSGN